MKVEVKDYTYETMPDYSDPVEGAMELKITGDELGVRYIPNVVYSTKDGVELKLQVMVPHTMDMMDPTVYPGIAYVQGSAWFKQDIYAAVPFLSRLASRGYVCAIVEYRHSGIAHFPAQVVDGKNAIRFLREHAAEYHIDPEKMVVMGCSSGGHTSAMIGLTCRTELFDEPDSDVSCDVKACIDLYGAVDVNMPWGFPTTKDHQQASSPEGQFMGFGFLGEPEKAEHACVRNYVNNDCPPMLLIHGTKDKTVFCQQSVDLYRAMKAAGKDAELCLLRGADHGGPGFWTPQVLDLYDSFIRRCLK